MLMLGYPSKEIAEERNFTLLCQGLPLALRVELRPKSLTTI